MLTEERRQTILERLDRDGKVVVAELSATLDVSLDTVRRDLQELAEAGCVRRVHGGTLPPAIGLRPYAVRREQAPAAKAAIARATAGSCATARSSCSTRARRRSRSRATFPRPAGVGITNSPPIAVALADHPSVEVTVLGGNLDEGAHALVGAATVAALPVRADVLILGVCSLHPEIGITVLDLEESYVKRAMIANAAEIVAVSSAEKLGSSATFVVGSVASSPISSPRARRTSTSSPYRALGVA